LSSKGWLILIDRVPRFQELEGKYAGVIT